MVRFTAVFPIRNCVNSLFMFRSFVQRSSAFVKMVKNNATASVHVECIPYNKTGQTHLMFNFSKFACYDACAYIHICV